MSLPESDLAYLADRGFTYDLTVESNMTCIVFRGWLLPPGYDRPSADLLIRLPGGYPDLPPDMWWFDPAVKLPDGKLVQATEVNEQHLGRSWQRWSRHFPDGHWKSGLDGLESFMALMGRELRRCALQPV